MGPKHDSQTRTGRHDPKQSEDEIRTRTVNVGFTDGYCIGRFLDGKPMLNKGLVLVSSLQLSKLNSRR
jgi:hypothetical protein